MEPDPISPQAHAWSVVVLTCASVYVVMTVWFFVKKLRVKRREVKP
jgi:hypothetical protein